MNNKTLLLADSIHINEKNFKSFLAFFRSRHVTIVSQKNARLPIDAFGDYEDYREVIEPWRNPLAAMSKDQLGLADRLGVNLFAVCCAEALSLAITRSTNLTVNPSDGSQSGLFESISRDSYDLLLDNMAVAAWWIDHWATVLRSTPRLAYVAVFSGSLTYARVLLELMKFHPARCFVLESFFTGIHYYCEERYTPIANSSDIRLTTVRKAISAYSDANAYEVKRNAAQSVVQKIKNKNVTQPEAHGRQVFRNASPTLLILGQVMNDFSLLDSSAGRINSIRAYCEMIEVVLGKTDWNILFKAHPWERNKANLKRPVTKEIITTTFGGNPRVACVEDYALTDAFRECEAVACLNSQSGIEAAVAGFKPVQFGSAFWGGNGFSHDLLLSDVGSLEKFLQQPYQLRLRLEEFDQLEKWLVTCLDRWLVEEAISRGSETRLKQIFHEIAATPAAVSPGTKAIAKPAVASASDKASDATANVTSTAGSGLLRRRFNKLVQRPDLFFRDSKFKLFQWLGLVLSPRSPQ
jgi:hypothetical protein